MHSLVQPNGWVALKVPSGNLRVLQVIPDTTISLGKYGSFPSNLIINRPFHLTYELQDKLENESFTRLRIVPASELYSDILAESSGSSSPAAADGTETATAVLAQAVDVNEDGDAAEPAAAGSIEYSLVDPDSGAVVARTGAGVLESAAARQTLTMEEIEALKRDGTAAGKDLIAKLMLSHTALDQKTEYSLAKYKLLKTRKYIRRFSVLPVDVPLLDHWLLEEKDPNKILDMREEMLGLLGCWANVHCGVEADKEEDAEGATTATTAADAAAPEKTEEDADAAADVYNPLTNPSSGRWLVVDDTGCLLTAALAERMGFLYPPEGEVTKTTHNNKRPQSAGAKRKDAPAPTNGNDPTIPPSEEQNDDDAKDPKDTTATQQPPITSQNQQQQQPTQHYKPPPRIPYHNRPKDLDVPFSRTNTITLLHSNSQPNASFLRYFSFDTANPDPRHPLSRHLLTLSWLQLLHPQLDAVYASPQPPTATPDELRAWKANRRGTYHRKRRRWARVRHVVDATRAGGFSGLVVASTMDPVSVLRHAVPLLRPGAPVAVYCQAVEPLTRLMDAYSISRRAAWAADPPARAVDGSMSAEQVERWPPQGPGSGSGSGPSSSPGAGAGAGTEDEGGAAAAAADNTAADDDDNDDDDEGFPLNPTLLLGASLQTSRARKWQVLPGRTHPLMTGRGGAEGYVFTAWRVKPAEGRVEARGKARSRKRKVGEVSGGATTTTAAAAKAKATTTATA